MTDLRPKSFSDLDDQGKRELWSSLALISAKGIGLKKIKKLLEIYGSAHKAVQACLDSDEAWAEVVGSVQARAFQAQSWRKDARQTWQAIKEIPCFIILWTDALYPRLLRELPDPPLLLYARGNTNLLNTPAIGIVGSRSCTREGIFVTAFFAKGLSKAGVTVISGLAKGIDRAAHLGGLEGCGSSIAVLGTGIDLIYPQCNHDLAALMLEKGLILSEFPPGTPPSPTNFPVRNRIISGLSCGILVVEAAKRSGSLITARLALEQGRDVFSVPGHTMAAVSEGCRELIRKGAKPVFNSDDILLELSPLLTTQARTSLEKRLSTPQIEPPAARHRSQQEFFHASAITEDISLSTDVPLIPGPAARPAPERTFKTPTPQEEETGLFPSARLHKLSDEEHAVLTALKDEPLHIDSLALKANLDIAATSRLTTLLEVRGILTRRPGAVFALNTFLKG